MRNGLSLQGGTSTGRGVNDTCDDVDRAVRAAEAPTLGTAAVPIIAAGIVDGQTSLRRDGALADQRPRARLLHRAQGGRPRQRHLPLASQCAARRGRGHERRVADGNLSHERRAVPGSNRTAAGAGVGHPGRGPRCCRAPCTATASTPWTCASRRSCGSARRKRTWAWTCTTCSTPTRRRRTRRFTIPRRTGRNG